MLTENDLKNIRVKAEMDNKSMGEQATFRPDIVLQLLDSIAEIRAEGYRAGQLEMRQRAVEKCRDPASLSQNKYQARSAGWQEGVVDAGAAIQGLAIVDEET